MRLYFLTAVTTGPVSDGPPSSKGQRDDPEAEFGRRASGERMAKPVLSDGNTKKPTMRRSTKCK